jgi:hypothetical protein
MPEHPSPYRTFLRKFHLYVTQRSRDRRGFIMAAIVYDNHKIDNFPAP